VRSPTSLCSRDRSLLRAIIGWASSIANEATRNRWIQSTVLAWFFVGLIFFSFVDSGIFGRPIGAAWTTCISNPFFKLPKMARYGIGWLSLLALVFGSSFGFPLKPGTTYGQRVISIFGYVTLSHPRPCPDEARH
jgi:CNT family concentrative nucleoside transporter